MLRTSTLALVVLQRLQILGPSPESEVVAALETRAPGRAHEVISVAQARGMIRVVEHVEPVCLEAAGYEGGR